MSLSEFYKSYAEWLSKGAPNNMPYSRHSGLCHAAELFSLQHKSQYPIIRKQVELFIDAGLNVSFPFHDGDMNQYHYESILGNCHKNVQRVNWVHAHAN